MTPSPVNDHCTAAGTKHPPLQLLPFGSIEPQGWIYQQMKIDLEKGIKGNFHKITTNVSQNLFASQTRQPGTWVDGARGRKEKAWWAGEHEGYWIDSITRSAILLKNESWLEFVRDWMERVLTKFAETGYVGIYDAATRLPAVGFDGELWTQSRAFQGMLTWYEHSRDARVLEAVEATVHLTIDHYRTKGTYFGRPEPDGGVTHGVGYMDTLEWLWRLTGDAYYAEAAVWLYADYSDNAPDSFDDLTVRKMRDAAFPWGDHGAHVGEALHMPAVAYFHSGRGDFDEAANHVLTKLENHTNPGGGMALGYLEAVAASRGGGHALNENCAHVQSLMSLSRLQQYRPDARIGAWQECCAYNVLQGARLHPVDRAVSYITRDNRLYANDPELHGGRELYSACHEPAACCVLNVPRTMAYVVESLWFRSPDGGTLLANGYGPNRLSTEMNGTPVTIETCGSYPFSDKVQINVTAEKPVHFTLRLRVPTNVGTPKLKVGEQVLSAAVVDGCIELQREWRTGDQIAIDFDFQVVREIQRDGREAYWQWGPLVFTLPFAVRERIRLPIDADPSAPSGFHEYLLEPESTEGWDFLSGVDTTFRKVELDGDDDFPWAQPPVGLTGDLYRRDGQKTTVQLRPFGSASLRRTTFPLDRYVPSDAPDVSWPHEEEKVTADNDPMRNF